MLRITTFRPSATERTDAVKEQVSRTHEVGLASVGRGIDFVDLSPATADVEVAPWHGVGLAARHRAIQILDDARRSPMSEVGCAAAPSISNRTFVIPAAPRELLKRL